MGVSVVVAARDTDDVLIADRAPVVDMAARDVPADRADCMADRADVTPVVRAGATADRDTDDTPRLAPRAVRAVRADDTAVVAAAVRAATVVAARLSPETDVVSRPDFPAASIFVRDTAPDVPRVFVITAGRAVGVAVAPGVVDADDPRDTRGVDVGAADGVAVVAIPGRRAARAASTSSSGIPGAPNGTRQTAKISKIFFIPSIYIINVSKKLKIGASRKYWCG